jgi:dolichol-phosphate mannosyltransferase
LAQRFPNVFQYYEGLAIVVPVKNEIQTITRAIDQLVNVDLLDLGFIYSLLFVDGGSTDGTYEKLLELSESIGISVLQVPNKHNIGKAIHEGIASRSEEYVITFPADCEYPIDSIIAVAKALRKNSDALVIASRLVGQSEDNAHNLEIIYGNSILRRVSKFGGMLLTVILGLRFQRWITDPLSSVKGIKISQFESLDIKSESFSIHTEIIRKCISKSVRVIEIPTTYFPRSYRQGKKTNVVDGLKALLMCLKRIDK